MKIYKNNLKLNTPPSQAIRYVTVAFSVISLVLIAISIFSFLGAKKVEQEYNILVDESFQKMKLVSDLHKNEEIVFQSVAAHLSTNDPEIKNQLESSIQEATAKNEIATEHLRRLLKNEKNIKLLDAYVQHRETNKRDLKFLLELSRNNNTEKANAFSHGHILPSFKAHQGYLDSLSENIKNTAMSIGNTALSSIKSSVSKFNFLLLVALLATIVSGLLISKFITRLKKDNTLLNAEIRERQQLEEALSQSQIQYKSLFNSNPVPMWVYNQDSLYFLDVNNAAIQEYGYSKSEFMHMKITDLMPEETQNTFSQFKHQQDSETMRLKRVLYKRKDKSLFYVNIESISLPEVDSIKARLVVATNVNEQVQAIEQLEKNEKQIKEISSSIPGAVYQFQLDADQKFKFNYISEGVQNVFGLSPKQLYEDQDVLDKHLHPDDHDNFMQSILRSYQNLEPWELEFRIWQEQLNKYIWIRGHSLPSRNEEGTVLWNGTIIDINSQKEAQNKLVNSEANLRALLDSSPQAIYLLDSNLNIISFNAEAQKEVQAHLLKNITIKNSILDYVADNNVVETVQAHTKALEGETIAFERRHGNLWFEIIFRPVKTPDNEVIAVALNIENITEQKQILETIRRNELQLERAQELANLGYWEYDVINSLSSWSDNTYTIYGVDKEHFNPSSTSIINMIHPDDRDMVHHTLNKSIEKKQQLRMQHRIIRPDGDVRNVVEIGEIIFDETGRTLKMWGTIQDITDRKKTEEEALAAKNLLQSTIENIPEIIFSADSSLRLTYVSPQSLDILGYSSQELLGNSELWTKGIHRDDFPQLKSQFIPKLKEGHRQQQEIRAVTRDGEIKWLMLRASPVLDANGNLVRLDGSAADITYYKNAEEKRNELTGQLMVQNQNLQQFAYIVSHNLRAPIANILGLTSIYDRLNPGISFNEKVIDNLHKSAQRLDSTIHDLNDLLTLRTEINCLRENVSFETIFNHVQESLNEEICEAGALVDIDFNHAPDLVTIKSYLQSIMLNLISNALKYRNRERNLQLQVKTFKVPDYICLTICDNGMGIDLEKEKGKIFGLYKRFHHSIEGKGLGLHLVKTQAELLGGKVDVESTVNVGTTFSVYFKV